MKPEYLAATMAMLLATPAAAEELSPAIRLSATCAPVGTLAPSGAPRLRPADAGRKTQYSAGEQVAIDAGTESGLDVDQRFFIRRRMTGKGALPVELTVGWLTIVNAAATTAVARIDYACDAVSLGDHIEPYADPILPAGIDRTNATGTLDFDQSAKVLLGVDGRTIGGGRDFALANLGHEEGVTPGARYAVFYGSSKRGELENAFAEAVVVSVFDNKALLRITDASDAVSAGDRLVLRVGGIDPQAAATLAQTAPAATPVDEPRVVDSARLAADANELLDVAKSFSFEDLHFDFDRFTLRKDSLALLDQAIEALKANPSLRIRIEGYTCDVGTPEYNLALGERRAIAAREYVVSHGIPADRLSTVSYGEEEPKFDNKRKDTRLMNRRAALVVHVGDPAPKTRATASNAR